MTEHCRFQPIKVRLALNRVLTAICLCAIASHTLAQDSVLDEPEHEGVGRTFSGQVVINTQSADLMPKVRGFGFIVQHRFGAFGPDEQVYKQFIGMDLPANLRLGLSYAPCRWFQIDLGRTKSGKAVDLGGKFRIMGQTTDEHSPLSISAYLSAAVMTDDWPASTGREFYPDSVTPFDYRFEHRMSYAVQVMIARKLWNWGAVQVSPVVAWRNLAPVGGSNLAVSVTVAARFRVSPKGSILIEYPAIVYGRQPTDHLDPMSIAYEIATTGHVFQIVLSTGTEILEQRLLHTPAQRYDKGYVLLGFNISRVLVFKPRKSKKKQ